MKRYLLLLCSFFLSVGLLAQTGEIQGKVIDMDLGEGLPFAAVSVTVNGSLVGAQTDFDGFYSIKPLPPGKYDLVVQYVGYRTSEVKDIVVSADKITFLDVEMFTESELLEEVVIVEYKVPLMEADETSTGNTVTKEEIGNLPTRNVSSIASNTAGVYQSDEGGDLNVKGARSEATDYYIDGIKVRGSSAVPVQAIEQMTVITGGVPAKYGDATGGIINITTRGPSRQFGGGFEVLTSQFTDPYNYNLFTGSLAGPILKANKGEPNERALLGFFIAGEYLYEKDDDAPFFDVPRVRQSVLDSIIANPLRPSATGSGFDKSADFITDSDLEYLNARENIQKNEINANIKFDFQPVTNLNFTFGASGNFYNGGLARRTGGFRAFARRFDLFTSDRIPEVGEQTYRGFVRFTQRFGGNKGVVAGDETEDVSLFSNAYYSIQLDYTKYFYNRQDPLHEDRYFDFGYVGNFQTDRSADYFYGPLEGVTKTVNGQEEEATLPASLIGWQFGGLVADQVNYTSGTANPIAAAHNDKFFELAGDNVNFYRTVQDIIGNGGLWNGSRAATTFGVYSTYYAPGVGSGVLDKFENDQSRLTFNGSVDIKKPGSSDRNKHAIEFGFEYEQRIDRRYRISTADLWDRMRRQISRPGQGIELSKNINDVYLIIDGQQVPLSEYTGGIDKDDPVFGLLDTIGFNFVRTESDGVTTQSYFDRQFRERFGLQDINAYPYVDTDAYAPSELSLDLFSPDDLFGSGSNNDNLLTYYGFDYLGNKLTEQPAFEDFWKTSEDGLFNQRSIGAYRPIYMAGYIQDKFSFRDLIFNVGVRVDRFDANQKVPRDPYSLYGTVKAGDTDRIDDFISDYNKPESIGDDYVLYVDNEKAPTVVKGYRNGDDWYNAQGERVNDANILSEGGSVRPFLSETLGDDNPIDDIKDPNFVDLINTAFEDYEPQITVMPRVSFSFPISDAAKFFANYSVLSQRPQGGNSAFAVDYYFFRETGGFSSNPNLKPEKTISYQIGFQQKVSRTSAISLSTFYREMRDMRQVRQITFAYPLENYTVLDNIDFGTVKGFEFKYDLRRTGNIRLLANYTLQFADGTGSDAFGASNQVSNGQGNLRSIRPLSFDSRHGLNVTIDYRYGEGSNYNGPRIGEMNLLQNAGANLIVRASSGTPFTRQDDATPTAQFGVAGRTSLDGQINGSRLPWNYRLDFNVDKDFDLKFGKEGKKTTSFNVYLQIQNLLNTRNLLSAYSATGAGEDDGYLLSKQGQEATSNQSDEEAFLLLYGLYMRDPNNFNLPRRIRIGASISF